MLLAFEDTWKDYEFLNKDNSIKLKDLNRQNLRHIEKIKNTWNNSRSKHISRLVGSNPFALSKSSD